MSDANLVTVRSDVHAATEGARSAIGPDGRLGGDGGADQVGIAIERSLASALERQCASDCPPRLAAAMRHALFPAGARIRPRLTLAVVDAIGSPASSEPGAAHLRVATAIELMHGASLVQDDLPCFDAAQTRRGQRSVHAAFDARLAILASDGLIMAAFETLAETRDIPPRTTAALVALLASRTGARGGITAGQAWESEAQVDLERYHAAKTGSLFALATEAGALVAGLTGQRRGAWSALGARIGAAYQLADDLKDATSDEATLGKPVNVDARLERPSAASSLGLDGASQRLAQQISALVAAVPDCTHRDRFVATLLRQARAFLPDGSAIAASPVR